jgi:tRNA dimethylallyltransferase|uniref:tRNA (adenosine(37)-N6)-dimethylallyltransferase MiaA n=1 Tax=Orrella sp. TaxID=1921583 RepID=UPI0040487D40
MNAFAAPAWPPLLCLAGPTASGKSAASVAIAEHLPIEIINVDSATIYRGMDIGTAKPDHHARATTTHHLLDILDPSQSYSAAQFLKDAQTCVHAIRARGNIPLLVGGTMLYFKVLRDGIDDLPSAPPALRSEIQDRAQACGWPAMHQALAKLDPITAKRLAPNDSQRIGRALEVYHCSGRPLSDFFNQERPTASPIRLISLEPQDRARLHERIEQRFDAMLEQGLEAEVRALHERGDLSPTLPSIRCVGYRQLWAYIEGHDTLSQAREKAIAATRQLAKRQLTWLRGMPEREIIDCLSPNSTRDVLNKALENAKLMAQTNGTD